MTAWVELITLLLSLALTWWKESRAKIDEAHEAIVLHQKKRLEIYEAIASLDSWKISRLAEQNALELRHILDTLPRVRSESKPPA